MPKNYYLILGIPSEATLDDIKEAYRRLAKAYHPDRYGENHSPFLAIQEAYSVLSDPIKRQTHDLEVLNQKKKLRPRYGSGVVPGQRPAVEPLIPEQKKVMDLGRTSLSRSFQPFQPPFDDLFDRAFSNFSPSPRLRRGIPEDLNLQIQLTPEQAVQGGQIKVLLPVHLNCPSCSGRGWNGLYQCWRCTGQGVLSGEYPVMISYPSGIADHHTVQLPLDRYGIENRCLTVSFHISRRL